MNKALEDLQAGRDRIAAGEPITEDPTPYRRAGNFSVALPVLSIFVTQMIAITRKTNPGLTGDLLVKGGAVLVLLLVLAGLLLAIKALRARKVEIAER